MMWLTGRPAHAEYRRDGQVHDVEGGSPRMAGQVGHQRRTIGPALRPPLIVRRVDATLMG
jgi:hypothetical protein